MQCTLAPLGETIDRSARRRCGLMSNYSDHLCTSFYGRWMAGYMELSYKPTAFALRSAVKTNLCSASTVHSQHDAAHICCWAPAPAAIDPGVDAQQQTRRPPFFLSIDRRDRQTDKWTDDRPLLRLCSAIMRVAPIRFASHNRAINLLA